jgi:protein-tyrosine phosphatase
MTESAPAVGFIDLHSHVLPGLDDGSPDLPTSLELLRGLRDLGFTTICATPHQKAGQYLPSLESIDQAHQRTRQALDDSDLALQLPLGAENMWDGTLYERMEAGTIPSYDRGPAFLVEFRPSHLPLGLFERLFDLRCKGKLPVIAHPERYAPLWKDAESLEKLRSDCAMVVDLGALSGYHGRKQAKFARKYLLSGIAHAAASDLHSPEDLPGIAKGIEWIRKKLGEDAVQRLLADNPAKILAGQHPEG